jgi:hypothetical protein
MEYESAAQARGASLTGRVVSQPRPSLRSEICHQAMETWSLDLDQQLAVRTNGD